MDERILKIFKKNVILNDPRRLKLSRNLGSNLFCYVLITCQQPEVDGKMQVEMSYEGDKTLASYLVQTAAKVLE